MSWSVLRALPAVRCFCTHSARGLDVCRTGSTLTIKGSSIRTLNSTPRNLGLEEFFPDFETDEAVRHKAGRSWRIDELRQKDDVDLHKLWYVLLKERNMLLTLKQEATRLRITMPAPERLRKVRYSMSALKAVLKERDVAIKQASRLERRGMTTLRTPEVVEAEILEQTTSTENKKKKKKLRWKTPGTRQVAARVRGQRVRKKRK